MKKCEAEHLCWRYSYSKYFLEKGYAEPPTREVLFFSGYAAPEMMPRRGIFAESIPLREKPAGLCPNIRTGSNASCPEFQKFYRQHLKHKANREKEETRKNIPPDIRRQVSARDKYTCVYCHRNINFLFRGQKIGGVIDHVIPLKLGGTDSIENLVLACRKCNSDKGIEIWQPGCRKDFYL